MRQGFLFGRGGQGQARRIVEPDVDHLGFAGEEGARLVGVVADGHDEIEIPRRQFRDRLGFVSGDVHAGFGHDLHGAGVQAVDFEAGGEGLDPVAFQRAGPAFGHLAAAGVAGAKEEEFQFPVTHGLIPGQLFQLPGDFHFDIGDEV